MTGWIAVDLDGTLAEYHGWPADGGVGAPIKRMVDRVKDWLSQGTEVRIFTARVGPQCTEEEAYEQRVIVQAWCLEHLGQELKVTASKDFNMIELWDDRCVQVEHNTGRTVGDVMADAVLKAAGDGILEAAGGKRI